ncbi:dTDP-glucose 4,6-dehydratase [Kushneria sinocarnis]|uniref:dTDP-glucose 4,6-dehydratase n=1 Tax=Kushneria sinocarnis TaxID=595502 RepID=A0A420WZ49_9GAMM|nr:dTDP-glucose 4,6-dehydratase [Kushneria sinocarnis]RKR06613.1 dTDP-glucose 4,6-dehydratase [Kushneria sinocarnis]
METIMVTGGAGFIGSALVRHIIGERHERVVNVDALTYAGQPDSLAELAGLSRYRFERGDVRDGRHMARLLAEYHPRAVMHLAAQTHVDRSITGPGVFVDTNVNGVASLLEASRQHWQTLSADERAHFRFLHVSTDEVYGALAPDAPPPDETAPMAPSSPYAASKAGGDHLVNAWHATYGLPTLLTRATNNYGPGQYPEKLIPLMILNALAGRSLPIYGDGGQSRDWLHVDDHVRALCQILDAGRPGASYNIAGGCESSNLAIVEALCDALEQQAGLSRAALRRLITHVPDRPGHDRRYSLDGRRMRDELGWRPHRAFDPGLEETVGWYLRHEQWCRRLIDPGARAGRA